VCGCLERSSHSALTQSGGTHLGLRANASPFAGRCRTGGLQGGSSSVRARLDRLVCATSEEGSALRRVRTRQRGVWAGSRRGLDRRKTPRTFTRAGPVRAHEPPRRPVVLGSPAGSDPARGRKKAKAVEVRHLSQPYARNRRARGRCPCFARFAEVGSKSPCPDKRTTGLRRGRKPLLVHGARERGLSRQDVRRA
jgi:hypothetical protein